MHYAVEGIAETSDSHPTRTRTPCCPSRTEEPTVDLRSSVPAHAVLWTGYLCRGLDFGVGMLPASSRRRRAPHLTPPPRRTAVIINTIGPVWTATGGLSHCRRGLAAFPEWYATLFSGFYIPLDHPARAHRARRPSSGAGRSSPRRARGPTARSWWLVIPAVPGASRSELVRASSSTRTTSTWAGSSPCSVPLRSARWRGTALLLRTVRVLRACD